MLKISAISHPLGSTAIIKESEFRKCHTISWTGTVYVTEQLPPNCSMLISKVKKPGLEAFPHSSSDLSLCFVGNGPVKTNSPAQQSSTFPWGLSYHSPNKMFYHSPNKGLTVFSSTRNEKKKPINLVFKCQL